MTMGKRRILRDNRSFRGLYEELRAGDCVIGLLNLKPTEEDLFLDLSQRGIILFPSALAQKIARSKCMQAYLLKKWMLPQTTVIRDRHDMIRAVTRFSAFEKVVTKQDRMNCGLGINIWNSIEDVYNEATFGGLKYPFVLQPFFEACLDIRVIIIGDYVEAYWRKNRSTFRNNLYFGGESGPYKLSTYEYQFCRSVMERGDFPYAHLDLMVSDHNAGEKKRCYLAEINLRGGLKGAKISIKEYKKRISNLEEEFIRRLQS
ncbi:MAG TPA: hypothetical protein ENJ63_05040 [Dissulfuribacter thermophilus]|uniref:ATP-grasp fold RimK-type domain-containing protein n=1 Tax=Dissulfuribacter thermophilus TaxID=1156395 RepID=A0A7V2WTE0_9BACT|nr:hypothetical protein [Dissulfuribacter thermophilus]